MQGEPPDPEEIPVRRLATAGLAVATTAAVLTLSTGTAFAHEPHHAGHGARASHGKSSHRHHPKAKVLITLTGVVSDTPTAVVVTPAPTESTSPTPTDSASPVATDSASPVATESASPVATDSASPVATDSASPAPSPSATSDTATSTLTVVVKGGERSLHGKTVVLTLDKNTVVRRGDHAATAADLRPGDHVSVRARRMPDGS